VQLSAFGRLLKGEKDELSGFARSLVKINDGRTVTESGRTHYDNVRFTGRNQDRVSGTAFEITDAELAAADEYERDAGYERVTVTLASGKKAWVYLRDERHPIEAPVELTTARLFLRKPAREDAPGMFAAYAQDAEVTRFLLWKPHPDVSESYRVVDRFVSKWKSKAEFSWFIFPNDGQQLIGSIAARPKPGGFELGYVLARSEWGKGYMAEAIGAVVHWAFTDPSVFRISAACDVENRASARALEKAGFVREGVLPQFSVHPNISDAPRDCYCYVMLRANEDRTSV